MWCAYQRLIEKYRQQQHRWTTRYKFREGPPSQLLDRTAVWEGELENDRFQYVVLLISSCRTSFAIAPESSVVFLHVGHRPVCPFASLYRDRSSFTDFLHPLITLIYFPSNYLFDLSRMLKLGSLSIPLKGSPPKLFGNHSLLINGD